MNFGEALSRGLEIIKLNVQAMKQVAEDPNALLPAAIILAIGGALGGVAGLSPVTIVMGGILAPVLAFVWVVIVHFVATMLGGSGDYMGLYKAWGHGPGLLGWAGVIGAIPCAGWILLIPLWIWQLVIGVLLVEQIHELTRGRAVAAILIPLAIFMVCCGAAVAIAIAMGLSMAALGGAVAGAE
ncbi:MAG: YIP1 family protein [Acidobacteriota bacterium]|nr:YIP1 family protein [Acidobacteriota bacterium]